MRDRGWAGPGRGGADTSTGRAARRGRDRALRRHEGLRVPADPAGGSGAGTGYGCFVTSVIERAGAGRVGPSSAAEVGGVPGP